MTSGSPFRTSVPYDELDTTPLRELPDAAWAEDLFFADELMNAVIDDHCVRIALEVSSGEVAPKRQPEWNWLLDRLTVAGLRGLKPRWDADALRAAIDGARDGLGPTFDLIELAARAYPEFLRGEIDGSAVLTSRDALPLWERYFDNGNVSYAATNRLAAWAASNAVAASGIRVLEVGGGFGSAAAALLEVVRDRVAEYRFTEKVPFFMAKGKMRLAREFDGVPFEFGRLDLDEPVADQGVENGMFDLVYAVNVLHAVADPVAAARALRSTLKLGGALVLGEAVRARENRAVPIEFVFQLTDEFRGFFSPARWDAILREAGFETVTVAPDFDRVTAVYPTYSIASIVAENPA